MQSSHPVLTAGDTLLHYAAKNCNSLSEFTSLTQSLSNADKERDALKVNDDGKLALDIIIDRQLNPACKSYISTILADWASVKKVKKLSEPIDFNEVVSQYHPIPGSTLYKNLEQACQIANEVRSKIDTSVTHPQFNGVSHEELEKTGIRLNSFRNIKMSNKFELLYRYANFSRLPGNKNQIKIDVKLPPVLMNLLTQNEILVEEKMGNCDEMTKLSYYLALEKKLEAKVYHYTKGKGDHVFEVVGDSVGNTDPKRWSKDAVICDAWAGLVCPAQNYQQELGDFHKFFRNNKVLNLITPFNPNFNILQSTEFLIYDAQEDPQGGGFVWCYTYDFSRYFDKLFFDISKNKLPQEIYLFNTTIRCNVDYAITKNIITEDEIKAWANPEQQLKKYFSKLKTCLPLLVDEYHGNESFLLQCLSEAIQEEGAEVDLIFKDGASALSLSAQYGLKDAVAYLLFQNADPNITTSRSGVTALFYAVQNGFREIVDLLLQDSRTKLKSITRTADEYRGYAEKKDLSIVPTMEKHITKKLNQGEPSSAITMSPKEIAEIMGYADLVTKLEQAEKNTQLHNVSKVSLFKPSPCLPMTSGVGAPTLTPTLVC